MALIDKASLLMVPSTYEDGTLYNVLPSGNKAPDETGNHNGYDQTRADFSFTRGSNLAATRVNSDGLIEKGRENLLLQSNSFDTTWANISSTETSGQEGYDGTNNAWLLTKSGTNGRIQQSKTGTGVYTFSVYAKAGANNWCTLIADFVSGTDVIVWFDLQNGIVGTESGSPIESKISSVDNGWYRISISFICPASLQTLRIYVADGDNDNSGTSGSIYIQSAQLEKGLVSTPYIETGSSTAQAGILEDMPRINYDANGENGALLLESSRTNLFAQSEYFEDWTGGGSITTNTAISPEGLQNASTFTTAASGEDLRDTTNVTGTYAYSVFVKLVDVGGVRLRIDAATDANAYFDLSDGSVYDSDGIIEADAIDYGNNWWRVYMVANVTNTQKIQVFTTDGTTSYANGSVYLFGAQLEAGSYASSYIPTHGAAVTRGADDCDLTGVTSLIGQTEGTLFLDFVANDDDSLQILFQTRTSGSSNVGQIDFRIQSGNLRALGNDASTTQFNINAGAAVAGTRYKCAVRYKLNDCKFYVNGVSKGSDTNASFSSSSLDKVTFNENGSTFYPNADIKQAIIFDEALSDSEMATLTTL